MADTNIVYKKKTETIMEIVIIILYNANGRVARV